MNDLQAESLISAQRAAVLISKAKKAGVSVPPRAAAANKNSARAARRMSLRRTKWPDYYYFKCRLKNRKTDLEYEDTLCMMLIQEVLHTIWQLGVPDAILETENLDSDSLAHLIHLQTVLGVVASLGYGIHGDGVPCNYDRTESVVMISINLPGLSGANGRMRIPIICLPDYAVGPHTFDDIFEVISWQMRLAQARVRPSCRHDGSPWRPDTDASRLNPSYDPVIPVPCCMCQCRGDWDWMGKCFHLPFHNVKAGCCWLCRVLRSEVANARDRPCTCVCARAFARAGERLLMQSRQCHALASSSPRVCLHEGCPHDFCTHLLACMRTRVRLQKLKIMPTGEVTDCRPRSCWTGTSGQNLSPA